MGSLLLTNFVSMYIIASILIIIIKAAEEMLAPAHFKAKQFESGQNRLVALRRSVMSSIQTGNYDTARKDMGRIFTFYMTFTDGSKVIIKLLHYYLHFSVIGTELMAKLYYSQLLADANTRNIIAP